jgi:hypothetical protein
MVPVTIIVTPAHAEAVRAALLTLYQLEAEALHHACEAYLRDRGSSAGVLMRRAALLEVDALLEQAGWELGGAEESERSLTANPDVLEEMLYAALLEAVEQLELRVRGLWREGAGSREVRLTAETVGHLLDLLAEVRGTSRGGEGASRSE